jgi:hypothetical protein
MKAPFAIGVVLSCGAVAAACAAGGDSNDNGGATSGNDDAASDTTTAGDVALSDGAVDGLRRDGVAGDAGVSDDAPGADETIDAHASAEAEGGAGPGGEAGADAAADVAPEVGPTCIESDAGCMSMNPGACAAGVLRCDGGLSFCQPIQSSQTCYTGPATTRDAGVCKDGTQTCLGTLGACGGEVLPAQYENCFNTLDDDCDGVVNNGCPESVALGADDPIGAAGGAGGTLGSVHCPVGAFVTRVDSWFDNTDQKVSGVSIYCATPTLVQGATAYTITLAANAPAPYSTLTGGADPANERADDCGLAGLTATTYADGLADGFVEGLGNHCGTSSVTLNSNNTITFDFTTNGDESYSDWANSPGAFFLVQCPSNEVVVGFNLRYGAWLDEIQPICAQLLVKYK